MDDATPHFILYLVSPIMFVLLNTNCNRLGSVTKTKCTPNIVCHSLQNNKKALYNLIVAIIVTY